ncbi:MAG: glucose-1-phosphate thymidylyltransferase [Bacteroidia bacterium]|nr:MAG: glucose-1-phosphate thymidylyltransferase [Bacteroidia bacterium]
MNYILFGARVRDHLLPFTFIRPVADIRVGILTMREKWEHYLQTKTSTLTEPYLSEKYPMVKEADNVLINASVFPDDILVDEIGQLKPNQTLTAGDILIAHRVREEDLEIMEADLLDDVEPLETKSNINKLFHLWDIMSLNRRQIEADYALLTNGRSGEPIPAHARVIAPENVFVEAGAKIELAMINASEGPVYIGKGARLMDGAMIKGPSAIGEGSTVRMGAKIYEASSIGPHCKVGGEMQESVIFGYSNKAHEGFLGHSVIGEWCNIGADTNTSNLKINYDEIRLWDYAEKSFVSTGLTFCGTFMGDHSKCGINTMFNTGTVVGVNAQVFGSGFMRNFIPSFAWGGTSGFTTVDFPKALEVAQRMYVRRNKEFTHLDEEILKNAFEHTMGFRKIV